jgi:hypothetical protein
MRIAPDTLSIVKELLTVTKKSQNARARCASAISSSAGRPFGSPGAALIFATARNQLKEQWRKFSVATRCTCLQAATVTEHRSYVELLTCPQFTQSAPTLPNNRSG